VAENWDIQFEFAGWSESRVKQNGRASQSISGWGDVTSRTKWNFVGNENEESAWAVLPDGRLPIGSTAIGSRK